MQATQGRCQAAAPCDSSDASTTTAFAFGVDVEDYHSGPTCRICWCQDEFNLIAPCNCKGTQKYVHVKCLRRWQENVQKRDPSDERAYRCGVCRARYSLAPPLSRSAAIMWHLFRGFLGASCIVTLAFGLAGPPWPPLALFVLVLLATRAHGTLAVTLLLAGGVLALMHARGLRLLMRIDDVGRLGLAVVRHGAAIEELTPGTLLVASDELEQSGMFHRSVVLMYECDRVHGAKGVILNQPMHAASVATPHQQQQQRRRGSEDGDADENERWRVSEILRTKNTTEQKIADGGDGSGMAVASGKNDQPSTAGDHDAVKCGERRGNDGENDVDMNAPVHLLGGPVGMPGEGMRQEVVVLHTYGGVAGAKPMPLKDDEMPASSASAEPWLYIGGRLSEVLERHAMTLSQEPSRLHKLTTPPALRNEKRASARVSQRVGENLVLIFHGISTWAEGQLEGEIRAGAWAFTSATNDDVISAAITPDQVWGSMLGSDRLTWLMR